MNPLGPSSLNTERTRLDAARGAAAHAAGASNGAASGGFAQLLTGARDAAETATPGAAQTASPPRAERPSATDDDTARAEAKDDTSPDEEGDDRTRASRDTGPTLAHWLLNGGTAQVDPASAANAAALPPAQQPALPTDDLKAAAMAKQVLEAVRQRARSAGTGGRGTEAAAPADDATARRDTLKMLTPGHDKGLGAMAPTDDSAEKPQVSTQTDHRFSDALQQAAGGAVPTTDPTLSRPATEVTAAAAPAAMPQIDTPVHDAGFGQAVGVTISRLAKEGTHEAHLQLNPAELGPVSVRIEMNGQEAKLSLGAAHAETRALLDASLPALTEAFRSDGLVLAAAQVGDLGRDGNSSFAGAFTGQNGQGGMASGQGGAPGGDAGQRDARPRDNRASGRDVTRITLPLPGATSVTGRPNGGPAGALDLYA